MATRQQTPPDGLKALYWGKRLDTQEIARKYDVSRTVVQQWLDQVGITTRVGRRMADWPFGGDGEDAIRLIERRPDLVIRFIPDTLCYPYKLLHDDETGVCVQRQSNPPTPVTSTKLIDSYCESYEARLCYKKDFDQFRSMVKQ